MSQKCESCSFVMEAPDDHGAGQVENLRCKNCCHPDGTPRTREEMREQRRERRGERSHKRGGRHHQRDCGQQKTS